MFQVEIHVHDSCSNCETCGYNSATVVTIKGDLGEAEFGVGASCFSGDDAEWDTIAQWLTEKLKAKGKPFPTLLDRTLVDSREQEYTASASSSFRVDAGWLENEETDRLRDLFYQAEAVYDNYYSMSNILRLFAEFDIYFEVSYSQDEVYDLDDEDYDDYEEDEECQDD